MNTNQTVLITGSNTGFGRLTAETLAKAGYTVFASMRGVNGKNAAQAQEIANWAKENQANLHVVELDVTDENSVNQAVASILEKVGKIDVLVNNAGFGIAGLQEAYTIEQAQQVFDVNVFGVLRANRAVLPSMRKNKSGLIISISSGLGRIVLPFTGIYAASKFALEALSENLHYEMLQFGIDSVIIEPGAYGTDFGKNMMPPADTERLEDFGEFAEAPMKMFAQLFAGMQSDQAPNPQDIADIVKSLIEMPQGKRPLRTTSGGDVAGANAINQVSEQVQQGLLKALGMA